MSFIDRTKVVEIKKGGIVNEMAGLLALQVDIDGGLKLMKEITQEISTEAEILGVSTVFKVSRKGCSGVAKSIGSGGLILDEPVLVCVLKVYLVKGSDAYEALLEFTETLASLELAHLKKASVELVLLGMGDLLKMTPRLCLPWPDLHTSHHLLVPAAEIWGDYVHPVLKKSLHDLVLELPEIFWGEFFCQGRVLTLGPVLK